MASDLLKEVELTAFGQSPPAGKRAETQRDGNTVGGVEPMTVRSPRKTGCYMAPVQTSDTSLKYEQDEGSAAFGDTEPTAFGHLFQKAKGDARG